MFKKWILMSICVAICAGMLGCGGGGGPSADFGPEDEEAKKKVMDLAEKARKEREAKEGKQ